MRIRSPLPVLLALVLACAPGCTVGRDILKFAGLMNPPKISLQGPNPPSDFRFSFSAQDVTSPPTDYTYAFDRTGRCAYEVTVRSPRRRQQIGEFEATEDHIVAMWRTLQELKFDELDNEYPESGDGPDRTQGVQTFYLFANNAEWRVVSRYQSHPALARLREVGLAAVRKSIQDATDSGGARPKEFVADTTTRVFHASDCGQLKSVPAQQRQTVPTSYDALNRGFQPCDECNPIQRAPK